jgi:ubiquinone/menaquinone biosynthesis C-methylase UbiE
MRLPFVRQGDAHALAVGMTGVKMGDRLAQIGCGQGARLGAIAAKVGLSGRAAAFVPDEAAAARAQKGGEQAGVLIEVDVAPPGRLPADNNSFDLVVVDETDAAIAGLNDASRAAMLREARRIVRGGGRLMIVAPGTVTGVGAIFKGAAPAVSYDRLKTLEAEHLRSARVLADREGLLFVEAVKPRADQA